VAKFVTAGTTPVLIHQQARQPSKVNSTDFHRSAETTTATVIAGLSPSGCPDVLLWAAGLLDCWTV
jgi:hypothetical protein